MSMSGSRASEAWNAQGQEACKIKLSFSDDQESEGKLFRRGLKVRPDMCYKFTLRRAASQVV